MHITRKIGSLSNGNNSLLYYLNDVQVYLLRDSCAVRVGPHDSLLNVYDVDLLKLAEAIGLNNSGQLKIDPTNENTMTFLKVTKCI